MLYFSSEKSKFMKKTSAIEDYYDSVDLRDDIPQLGILGFLREKLLVFEEHREKTVIKMIPLGINKLLDIGCEKGSFLINAHNMFKHAIGIDISERIINEAKKEVYRYGLSKKILLKKVNFENELPFRKGFFDLVTCVAVLEHLFDPEKAIQKINLVLRKRGYLILQVPNIAWLPQRLSLLFGSRPRTSWAPGWDGGHLNYFTFDSLEKLLEKSGFKIIKIGCSGVFARLRYIYPPLLSSDIIILARKK